MNASNAQYTVSRNNEQFGPYDFEELKQYVNEGKVLNEDLVFDGSNWVQVGQILGFPKPSLNVPLVAPRNMAPSPQQINQQRGGNFMPLLVPMFSSQGWIRFLSVLGFIGAVIYGIITLILLVGLLSGEGGLILFFGNLIAGFLFFYPSYLLWCYANAIIQLRSGFQLGMLKNAIEIQARFWKFMGIVTLVHIILGIVLFGLILMGINFLSQELNFTP